MFFCRVPSASCEQMQLSRLASMAGLRLTGSLAVILRDPDTDANPAGTATAQATLKEAADAADAATGVMRSACSLSPVVQCGEQLSRPESGGAT